MTCEEFLARYSEYRDERAAADELARLEGHLEDCESCARYDRAVSRGVSVLRDLPSPSASPDFHARLKHRIYHLEDGIPSPGTWPAGSAAVLAAAAAGLLALAWVPFVSRAPVEVELRPVSVERPAGTGEAQEDRELPSLFDSGPFLTPDRAGGPSPLGRRSAATPLLWRGEGSEGARHLSLGGTAVRSSGLR